MKRGKLNCASSGQGDPSHLHGAILARFAGIDIVHIPCKGGGAKVVGNSPGQFAAFVVREIETARELLKVSGAKRDF